MHNQWSGVFDLLDRPPSPRLLLVSGSDRLQAAGPPSAVLAPASGGGLQASLTRLLHRSPCVEAQGSLPTQRSFSAVGLLLALPQPRGFCFAF